MLAQVSYHTYMFSWWFLAGSIALGWWIVTLLRGGFRWWIQSALSCVLGFLVTSWLSFLLAMVCRSTNLGITLTNILLLVPLIWGVRRIWHLRRTSDSFIARALVIIIGLAPALTLYWLHSPYSNSVDGISSHGYSWGDLPLHMTLASFFAHQTRPILELSLLPHTPLTYPFLIDWQSGVLLNLGAGWIFSFALPGAILFTAACVLSVHFVRLLIGSLRAAGLHLALFLGMGSAAGIVPLVKDFFAGNPIWTIDYSNLTSQGLNLANPITSHFLPQRSFLFGFAAAMALLVIVFELWKKERWKPLIVPSAGIGLLPFAHVHVAVIAAAWWAVVALITMWKKPASRTWLGIALAAMLLVLAPQCTWLFHNLPAHYGHMKVGWMWNGKGSLLTFWIRQLGILIPLILFGLYMLRKVKLNLFLNVGFVGGCLLLIAGNMRIFHPSEFDNLKFMLYGFWILLIPAAYFLDKLSRTRATLLVPLVVGLAVFVGAHTVIRDVVNQTGYQLFDSDDIQAAQDLQGIIPLDATVATTERHNNMVASLVGRRVLSGYGGWLWSYGLDYWPALNAEKTIMLGNDDGTLVAQYNVSYIAVHTRDQQDNSANLEKLREKYHPIYIGYDWVVYSTAQ